MNISIDWHNISNVLEKAYLGRDDSESIREERDSSW